MSWDYWRLITLISLAGFFGLLLGEMMTFLFLGALLYLLWLQKQWFLFHRWLLKPKKHSPPHAAGVIDDVCGQIERMRSQNRNRKKKLTGYLKRFKKATAALPDGIVVMGTVGQVEWANFSARELLGIYWPRDAKLRVNNLLRAPVFHRLLEAPVGENQTVLIESPVNQAIQLELKVVEYANNDRLLIARDVTQTIKLQRMRRDFVANVSHELRTPLTVLKGYLESFDQASDPAMWQKALPVMQQQTERMHLMIKDLLALSQLETGEKPLRHRPTDVCKLLQSVLDDARRLEAYRDHHFKLNCANDKWLLADTDELHSAISNLVFNAVKYTPAGKEITVSWSVQNNTCVIEVVDNGEGIASHHLDRLTERFYRVDNGRDRDNGGTGLGLAIVKHVISRHKGRLEIISEIGEGATFRCVFPIAQCIDAPEV